MTNTTSPRQGGHSCNEQPGKGVLPSTNSDAQQKGKRVRVEHRAAAKGLRHTRKTTARPGQGQRAQKRVDRGWRKKGLV